MSRPGRGCYLFLDAESEDVMNVVTRRYVWLATLVTILSAPVFFLHADLATPASRLAGDWASSLSPSELEGAAIGIGNLAPAARKAVVARLSPARRAEVWRQNISTFLATDHKLLPEQTGKLQRISEQLTPALFEGTDPAGVTRVLAAVHETMPFLNREQYYSLFSTPAYSAGSLKGAAETTEPLRMRVARYLQSRLVLLARLNVDCSCHDHNNCCGGTHGSYGDCPSNGFCYPDAGGCEHTWFGCGDFWLEECEGICAPGT
jgi:hypothetical protein